MNIWGPELFLSFLPPQVIDEERFGAELSLRDRKVVHVGAWPLGQCVWRKTNAHLWKLQGAAGASLLVFV